MKDFERKDKTSSGTIYGTFGDGDNNEDRISPRRLELDDTDRIASHEATDADTMPSSMPLFTSMEAEDFRSRWKEVQTNFVDEPRGAVEKADALVNEVTNRLTSAFTENRNELERQWSKGDEVSTEELRRTLQKYRSFFERLLSF